MNNPWDAKNYYAFMKIEDMSEEYTWNDSKRVFVGKTSDITTGTVVSAD